MSIDILKDHVKSKKFGNLYLFYGPEEYLKKYYMDAIGNSVAGGQMKPFNWVVLEGKADVRKIIEVCETQPLLSDRKYVVVKNSTLFKSKGKSDGDAKGKNKPKDDDLLLYLKNVAEHTILLFCEEDIDKRVKLVDTIKKQGLIVEFQYQKAAELIKWVIKAFKSYGKVINQTVAAQLIECCEHGMTEILNEINKLVMYIGNRAEVTSEDIEIACTKSIRSRIFDLTDAISEKNCDKALSMLRDMIMLKEPLPLILYMIARQFKNILELKMITAQGYNMTETVSKMGISPYVASKISKQAGRFSVETLKKALFESLDYDIAVKTGKINDRVAIELLIIKYAN